MGSLGGDLPHGLCVVYIAPDYGANELSDGVDSEHGG